jgi:hydrogenase maturation protease
MGNPLRCDDGVGNKIAQVLQEETHGPEVTMVYSNIGGLGLLDFLPGYDQAIIIDAIQTPEGKGGQIHRLTSEDLSSDKYPATTHSFGLGAALELGAKLGLALPQKITILAVEAVDVTSFAQDLTAEVKQAVPQVVELVLQEIRASQSQGVLDSACSTKS